MRSTQRAPVVWQVDDVKQQSALMHRCIARALNADMVEAQAASNPLITDHRPP